MASFASMRNLYAAKSPNPVRPWWIVPLWVIGLGSTLYLAGWALFLLFLAFVFGYDAPGLSLFASIKYVATHAIPFLVYAAIGGTGLRLLLSSRRQHFGLALVVVETSLAIYSYMNPGSLPPFTHWLL